MSGWFSEQQTEHMRLALHYQRILHRRRSRYQDIAIYDTHQFGRMLALDDVIMLTERDEFVYHEMLVHPALLACPAPRRVLVVGGGDGGAAREVLRHDGVEEVVVAELDREVADVCRRFLPATAAAFDDARVRLCPGDGATFLARTPPGSFDAILVDAPDPVGHAATIFGEEFYLQCRRALTPEGVLAAQSDSPFTMPGVTTGIAAAFRALFPVVRVCLGVVPTYAGNLWTFTIASLGADPAEAPDPHRLRGLEACRYWSPRLHTAAFALPAFVEHLLAPAGTRMDAAAGVQRA